MKKGEGDCRRLGTTLNITCTWECTLLISMLWGSKKKSKSMPVDGEIMGTGKKVGKIEKKNDVN